MPQDPLPDQVQDLFESDGEWSRVYPFIFFFTCECGSSAVCHVQMAPKTDTWFTHCPQDGSELVTTVIVSAQEAKKRSAYSKALILRQRDAPDDETVVRLHAEYEAYQAKQVPRLFDELVEKVIMRYVRLPQHEARLIALWVAHTWCLPAAEFTPYIHLGSALPREGKTRLIDVVQLVVARPYPVHDPTPAALADAYAIAELFGDQPPTVLWDEIDSVFQKWSGAGLREIVNTGFQRGTYVRRAGGRRKPTFGPKLLAGLKAPPLTVMDRSFSFKMHRATRSERPTRLTPSERRALTPLTDRLRFRLYAFAEHNITDLAAARPSLPDELDDRAQDIAEPLLAIADAVGGHWPATARAAMIQTRLRAQEAEQPSDLELLLADIKQLFGRRHEHLYSADIVERLRDMPERPWKTQGLDQHRLAKMLSEFSEHPGGPRIKSRRMRVGGRPAKLAAGYSRSQFQDAWQRYGS